MRILLATLVLLTAPALALADHARLQELARQDQAVRMGQDDPSSDDARRHEVFRILAAGGPLTPQDQLHAGLVLQHTGLTYCDGKLTSLSAENYLFAHHLFLGAMEGGVEAAAQLAAAAIDRYLSFTVGTQRYGTNRIINQETGREELVPVDRSVTDEERRRFGVPPLAELLRRFPEQARPAESAAPRP
jgi:hypothetical protein